MVGTQWEEQLLRQLGGKSYLVENTEFWSMRDLVDISKGAFSTLPVELEQVATTLQQCVWEFTVNNFK